MGDRQPAEAGERVICPKCGAVIYPGDVACQICGYFYGSAQGDDDVGS
ncbi:MAG: zinc ribbon domain-containing protein [Desulfofustis sp.]|jgi:rubredoxin|nr:zinc ribbon domain-containing protein [Desulfofustis sp.]